MNMFRLAVRQWKYQIRKIDFWIMLFILPIFYASFFQAAKQTNFKEFSEMLNVITLSPTVMSISTIVFVTYACLLFIVSDIPAVYQGVEYQIIRMNREIWFMGQVWYLVLINITYFGIAFLLQNICYAISGNPYQIVPTILTPGDIGLWGIVFGLCCLLGCLMGMVCLVCNIFELHTGVGIALCAAMIWIWEFTLGNEYDLGYFSPVGVLQSYNSTTKIPVAGGYAYYVFAIILLLLIGSYRIRHHDIRTKAGA